MTSWDIETYFIGNTPTIWELEALAKSHKFTNIEGMKQLKDGIWYLIVNNRSKKSYIINHKDFNDLLIVR